jgi:restriction endonuclease S subunit
MEAWERTRLGDLVETQKGYAFKSGWYCGTGRPIVKVSDFTHDSVDSSDLVCIPESLAADYLKYELEIGDVVVQTVGSWPSNPASVVGKCVRIPSSGGGALLNQNAVKLSPANGFDRQFLFYLLRNEDFKAYIIGTAQGAASQAAITLEAIRGYEFNLPPLPVQQRIAGILSAYDDLIENNTQRIQILEQMAQALYREWFVHLRFPGHVKFKQVDSPVGKIPQGWQVVKFDELVESGLGGDWGVDEPDAEENAPVRIIRGTDFDDIVKGATLRAPRRFIACSSQTKRELRPRDLVVENSINAKSRCVGTTLFITDGILRRLGEPSIAASFCKVYRFKEPSLAALAHLHMRYLYGEGRMAFYQNVAANGIGNFQSQRFLESEYLVFPTDIQTRQDMLSFVEDLSSSTLADQIFNLRRTSDLLLPNLISGALDASKLDLETGK